MRRPRGFVETIVAETRSSSAKITQIDKLTYTQKVIIIAKLQNNNILITHELTDTFT